MEFRISMQNSAKVLPYKYNWVQPSTTEHQLRTQTKFISVFKRHSNTRPFGDLTAFDLSNSRLICYSDPHCSLLFRSPLLFQEHDKLRDEDLYKFLQDLKRPSPVLKRLKCIRGTLKLDISVAPEQTKHCYTPELAKLIPFPGKGPFINANLAILNLS